MDCVNTIWNYGSRIKALFNYPETHSHGWNHIMEVANLTLKLMDQDGLTSQHDQAIALLVALFHEAWDQKLPDCQKRDQAASDLLEDILSTERWLDVSNYLIRKICVRISFTREQNFGDKDWDEEIGAYQKIRDYVSDADKIAALGVAGVERARLYQIEYYEARGRKLTEQESWEMYWTYSWTPRLQYYSRYMRTPAGIKKSAELVDGMMAYHRKVGLIP